MFTHTAGDVTDGSTGDEAADSYHDYLKDIAAIVQLKVVFSAWEVMFSTWVGYNGMGGSCAVSAEGKRRKGGGTG